MSKYNVSFFESNSSAGLDQMVSDFINKDNLQVINVSITSSYDHEKKYILFCAAVAFSYEEE